LRRVTLATAAQVRDNNYGFQASKFLSARVDYAVTLA